MSATPDRPHPAVRRFEILARRRSVLVRRLALVTLVAFFTQQVLTNFTGALDHFIVDGLSWAYLYAFVLFGLIVVLTAVYTRSMDKVERELATDEDGAL
ncbi:Uncharacterized membrane protein, DUF485 family [Nocardioides sp. YR527]|uniref:DUF485 domain-containing protein n=1 Tax=Nocardioides sp. YR527 TaxID=1881028 RepID=UPI00088C67FD|nr:DUF485 domain-containing protein [Nocardioides sp. YR527]SDK56607.1 Uncharacterized membrane protein, DUF485 family [Nocardioides sp. YR527]